ncbi:pyrroline-5-carboxylate reductase [Clostridium sp.]|uniref:pyrroline-5-carboxylate reductase n=1 Tax=Clostridium sp. TaxID=1506 RepID=UPI0026190A9E|nr:pyrroline-5-carboxylate reductase [Clostridium sp.]
MLKKIGFIGCGNMGKAMLNGIINSNIITSDNIIVSTKSNESKESISKEFNVNTTLDNKEVAKNSDILFLAVKPNIYKDVINEINDFIMDNTIIVSIAAGIKINDIEGWLNKPYSIIRIMPNTPALVKEGMTAVCPNKNVKDNELDTIIGILKSFGEYELLEENYFDAFIALCGSSPAYVFVFIEAMADAAVKLGIPRKKAYKMAEQSILGSAKLALETGLHPGELKDMVCSPSGTTIEAIIELENQGFRNAVIKAMEKCADKSKNM